MTYDIGDFLYSKTYKYGSGEIIDIKNDKYFIQTLNEIVELDLIELEYYYRKI